MPNITVSEDVHSLLQAADNAAVRDSIKLGASDTVEFGALEISEINFPNLTTPELNAVTNATEGDTYFDSDRGQFVRFTAPASYVVVTSVTSRRLDSVAASGTVTLLNSGFVENGLVTPSPNLYAPIDILTIWTGGTSIDGQNFSSFRSYLYSDGTQAPVGWYDTAVTANFDSEVIPADSLLHFTNSSTSSKVPMRTHFEVVSDATTGTVILSETLKAGVTYEITASVSVGDMLNGNVLMKTNYTGLFSESNAVFTADDLIGGTRLGTFMGELQESSLFGLNTSSAYGFDSPTIGYYKIISTVTPSSDGSFTVNIKQGNSSTRPLYVGKATISVSKLTA